MAELLALKRLTASDLTFFERLFRTMNAGNQKGINLNADVLIDVLYPDLAAVAAAQPDGEISFPLTIRGPASAGPYRVRRKIVKGGAYKNWRLNGEFVYDPIEEPGRFDIMRPGDLAVFGFEGRPGPEAVTLVLLARDSDEDKSLHADLAPIVAGRSMAAISADRLQAALQTVQAPEGHQLSALARDPEAEVALEDTALGGAKGPQVLRRRRSGRPVSPGELRRAKLMAEQIGADGEALVDYYLAKQENPGGTFEHEWVSSSNAISPFDFRVRTSGGRLGRQDLKIDVKSTSGPFARDFHISIAEINEAAESTGPYGIYRLSELTEKGALLTICKDIREFAQRLVKAHNEAMHSDICADSFSVPVFAEGLEWTEPVGIDFAEEVDE
jgi:hypothetical protein